MHLNVWCGSGAVWTEVGSALTLVPWNRAWCYLPDFQGLCPLGHTRCTVALRATSSIHEKVQNVKPLPCGTQQNLHIIQDSVSEHWIKANMMMGFLRKKAARSKIISAGGISDGYKSCYYPKGFSCAKPNLHCSKNLISSMTLRVKILVFHFILLFACLFLLTLTGKHWLLL